MCVSFKGSLDGSRSEHHRWYLVMMVMVLAQKKVMVLRPGAFNHQLVSVWEKNIFQTTGARRFVGKATSQMVKQYPLSSVGICPSQCQGCKPWGFSFENSSCRLRKPANAWLMECCWCDPSSLDPIYTTWLSGRWKIYQQSYIITYVWNYDQLCMKVWQILFDPWELSQVVKMMIGKVC